MITQELNLYEEPKKVWEKTNKEKDEWSVTEVKQEVEKAKEAGINIGNIYRYPFSTNNFTIKISGFMTKPVPRYYQNAGPNIIIAVSNSPFVPGKQVSELKYSINEILKMEAVL